LPELWRAHRPNAKRTQAVASGCGFESARNGRPAKDYRVVCRVPGEWDALTERNRDRAPLEIRTAMKPRHAAALALVGWYLMTPPCRSVNPQPNSGYFSCFMDSQTPLREWVRVPDTKEFEYKTECQHAISDGCHSEVDNTDGTTSLEGNLCGADCIAADDSRLKSK
jgi:hypothetical protein